MARLVVHPGTPQAWDIQLKPGINFVGRGVSNDVRLDDLSISGSHCQFLVDGGGVTIKDMGSTNGTFLNQARIQESRLVHGQPLRLGSVDMIFYADGPVTTSGTSAPPPPPPAPILRVPAAPVSAPPTAPVLTVSAAPVPVSAPPPPPAPAIKIPEAIPLAIPAAIPLVIPAPALRISGLTHAPEPAPVAVSESETELMVAPTATAIAEAPAGVIDLGARFCKFHPKSAARYLCKKCNRTFCELCVTTLNVGGKTKINCRTCGVECAPMQVHFAQANAPKNFFATIPGSFTYPVRGTGIVILLIGMIIFAGIRLGNLMMVSGLLTLSIRNILLGIGLQVILGGYLFTLLQNMIHSTAAGDNEVPELSGINFLEDILLPFCRLLGLVLVCFVPAIALLVVAAVAKSPIAAIGVFPATLFGCIYFPMAFLAVAILDTLGAVNPLVIIPSILKVPGEYVVAVVVLTAVMVFSKVGDILLEHAFPEGFYTKSIAVLLAMLGVKFIWSLVGVYLLMVNTRVLGLLYLSKKDKLGWLAR